jgi:hypothetical protein
MYDAYGLFGWSASFTIPVSPGIAVKHELTIKRKY